MNCPDLPDSPRTVGPGRPKDMGKRAAILESAKRMFVQHGFDGASMDQIAADAGVSKLTVYSHFGDKETLFAEAVKSHCDSGLPNSLFEPMPDVPLRERLTGIASAFFAMICAPDAIAGHRILCSPQLAESSLSRMFWEAGPQRVQDQFALLLQRRVDAGELDIDDVARASSQFFSLLKGEPHMQRVLGCATGCDDDGHVAASVEMFLRAYASDRCR